QESGPPGSKDLSPLGGTTRGDQLIAPAAPRFWTPGVQGFVPPRRDHPRGSAHCASRTKILDPRALRICPPLGGPPELARARGVSLSLLRRGAHPDQPFHRARSLKAPRRSCALRPSGPVRDDSIVEACEAPRKRGFRLS